MKAIIRIKGKVKIRKEIEDTLHILRLRKKYSCVILKDNEINKGMIKKVKDFVAYGEIKDDTLIKLIEKRGQKIDKNRKIDPKKVVEELKKEKKLQDLNLKPFFRLHPPRGGINTKKHFPKGVLGDNKEKINELIERML